MSVRYPCLRSSGLRVCKGSEFVCTVDTVVYTMEREREKNGKNDTKLNARICRIILICKEWPAKGRVEVLMPDQSACSYISSGNGFDALNHEYSKGWRQNVTQRPVSVHHPGPGTDNAVLPPITDDDRPRGHGEFLRTIHIVACSTSAPATGFAREETHSVINPSHSTSKDKGCHKCTRKTLASCDGEQAK